MPKCIWCGENVVDGREESGSRTVDWMLPDGDFGCDKAPATGPDGTDGHAVSREEAKKQITWCVNHDIDLLISKIRGKSRWQED